MNERPLCPHCYRDACPWLLYYFDNLMTYGPSVLSAPAIVPHETCPHFGLPVPPMVRPRLRAALDGGVEMRRTRTDGHPWRFGQ